MISNHHEKLKSTGDHISIFSRFECYAAQMTPLTHLAMRLLLAEIATGEMVTTS